MPVSNAPKTRESATGVTISEEPEERCEFCGNVIPPDPKGKPGRRQRFCNVAHRVASYRKRKKDKAG